MSNPKQAWPAQEPAGRGQCLGTEEGKMMSKCGGDDDEDNVYSIEILVIIVIAVITALRQIIVRIFRLVQLETDERLEAQV